MLNMKMQLPYFPLITKFDDNPVTKGLEKVVLRFPSALKYTRDSSKHFIPITKSSVKSGTQPSPAYFNIQKQWVNNDFPLQGITMCGALTENFSGGANSKLVVIANGDF